MNLTFSISCASVSLAQSQCNHDSPANDASIFTYKSDYAILLCFIQKEFWLILLFLFSCKRGEVDFLEGDSVAMRWADRVVWTGRR